MIKKKKTPKNRHSSKIHVRGQRERKPRKTLSLVFWKPRKEEGEIIDLSRWNEIGVTWKLNLGSGGRSLRKSAGFLRLLRISSSTKRSTSSLTVGSPYSSSMYGRESMMMSEAWGFEGGGRGGASSISISPPPAISDFFPSLSSLNPQKKQKNPCEFSSLLILRDRDNSLVEAGRGEINNELWGSDN